MYQHWAANDPELAFPIYREGPGPGHPRDDPPGGLDADRREARTGTSRDARTTSAATFRDLRVIIAHCGLPWVDEALFLLTKHPNFYAELSYLIATLTRRDLFLLLSRCEPMFVPLEKLFFGTDYPGLPL